jgi:putative colanic acid biosynthesis acetyltransferase WcaF
MPRTRLRTLEQAGPYASPWPLATRLRVLAWQVAWLVLFRPTPKPMKGWRNLLLRAFGCRITGSPFVAASAIVKMPWNLVLEDRACLGPGAEVYNLAPVTLGARCVVAQQAYLCAGTHDVTTWRLPLVVGEITIGPDAFIGARALVLPGVDVGAGAVIGAGAVVTKDMPAWTVCAGNPCAAIRPRAFDRKPVDAAESAAAQAGAAATAEAAGAIR